MSPAGDPSTRRDEGYGEFRFNDPDWLLWWLQSHYLLPPGEQLAIAERIMTVVYAPESRQTLEGYILGLRDTHAQNALGHGTSHQSHEYPLSGHNQTDDSDEQEVTEQPVWKNAWVAMLRDQPKIVLVGGLLLVIYALRGLQQVWGLIF